MNRKVPLTRRTPLKRKTRLRPVSPKRAARMRSVRPGRKAYLEKYTACMVSLGNLSQEIHEITSGSNRDAALDEPAAWLAVSRHGHNVVQFEPKAKQLARKLLATPDEFDLDTINRLLAVKGDPNPPSAITLADVVPYLELRR